MVKSQDAFRTISEVSDWLDTPAHVLRFWESKFPQIKPVKRAGGRRYYRPDDMALLSGIKTLLHEQGMTIKGVQKLLREQGIRHVIDIGITPARGPMIGGAMTEDDWIDMEPVEAEADASIDTEDDAAVPVASTPADLFASIPDPAPAVSDSTAAPTSGDAWPADPAPLPLPAEDDTRIAASAADAEADALILADPAPADESAAAPPHTPAPPRLPPGEVSLPFVRARAEAAEPPTPSPVAEILSFAPTPRPPIPTIPDERGYMGHPGPITALAGADKAAIRANAGRIMPLVARLKVVADRIASQRD